MNRIYHLVWNGALRVVQVASELASQAGGRAAAAVPSPRRRSLWTALAAVGICATASPVFAQVCTVADVTACSAQGGVGFGDRPGIGGAGNGQGGGSNILNNGTLTPETGALPSNGVGGEGATGYRDGTPGGIGGNGGALGALSGTAITGGRGGDGGEDSWTAGGGGGGGAGAVYTGLSDFSLGADVSVTGGAGGTGGAASVNSGAGGGGGGGGGAGFSATASNVKMWFDASNAITGGAGGAGGSGDLSFQAFGGGGGGGGDGLLLFGSGVQVNNLGGTITGGAGGAGGNANTPGGAGEAGAGVRALGVNLSLINLGTISGGAGTGTGVAGIGVVTQGFSIIQNGGTIEGGLTGTAYASAILFQGANNTLAMVAGSAIHGAVEVADGSNVQAGAIDNATIDEVKLDGSTAAIDLSVAAGKNLTIAAIDGTGNVTSSLDTGNLILQGVQLDGSLTLDHPGTTTLSGTLHTSGSQHYGMPVSLANDTTVIGDAGPVTFLGAVTGAHNFSVQTAGDIALTNAGNAFGGNVALAGNTVDLSSASALSLVSLQAASNASIHSDGAVVFSGDVTAPSTLTLDAPTSSVQQVAGSVSAGMLSGTVGGNLVLGSAGNAIVSLGTLTAGTISIADAIPLTVAGTVHALQKATFNTVQGVTVTGTLRADGALADNEGVQIDAGTSLMIGSGGTTGTLDADASVNGSLAFNRSDDVAFSGDMKGTGTLAKFGTGKMVYEGDGSQFQGSTTVADGTLVVGGAAGSTAYLGGAVHVSSGASLGGHGTIGGSVDMVSGSALSPGNSVGTLTVNGDLTMAQGTVFDAEFGAGGTGDKVIVGGNLALNGVTLNVADAGGMGPGVYNLFSYGGSLTTANGGLLLGSQPAGRLMVLQTLTGQKQINLIDYTNVTLNYWNANGLASLTQMGGGDGTWSNTASTWTDTQGSLTAPMNPQPGFAIFGGANGTVTVDDTAGAVGVTGMQFLSDGYRVTGDALNLASSGGPAIVRVGDGTLASAGFVATIDAALTGAAGLTKTDAGTLVLNGVNTFSGGVTVSGGTLSIGDDRNLGDAGNDVSLGGGSLRVTGTAYTSTDRGLSLASTGSIDIDDAANVFTWHGAITGTGSLTKTGAGTLVLDHANSYSGATWLSDGALRVGDSAAIGTGELVMSGGTLAFGTSGLSLANAVKIAGDATVDVGAGSTATLTGDIADGTPPGGFVTLATGSLTKTGAGTLTLTGTAMNTGLTTIADGTLRVGDGGTHGALPLNIVNHGGLVLDRSDDVDYAGTMSGDGTFRKLGTNGLHLTGDSSAFTGTTTIDGGTLRLDGSLGGEIALASGAVLAGTGTAGSAALMSGSELSPGGSGAIGKLTFNGNLDLATGSRYAVDVTDAGQGDTVVVGGKANLHGGSVVSLGTGGQWSVFTTYTILSAVGGIDGTFGDVSSNLAFLTPSLAYTANTVNLTLRRNDVSFLEVANTRNQRATAGALQSLDQGTALYETVLRLDAASARTAFDAFSGEIHANLRGAIADDDRYQRDAINQHLLTQYTDGTGDATAAWASAWGHWGNHDADGNAARLRANGGGLMVGADTGIGTGTRVGFALGTGHVSASARGDSADGDTRTAGLYGSGHYGNVLLQAGALYSRRDIDTHRTVDTAGMNERLNGDTHARSAQVFVEGAYEFRFDSASLSPYLDVARQELRTNALDERGGDAALDVQGDRSAQTFATLGLRGSRELAAEGGIGVFASVGWQHAWGDTETSSRQRFATGGDAFQVTGTPIADNAGVATLGLRFKPAQSVTIDASYVGQFAGDAKDQSARLSLNWVF